MKIRRTFLITLLAFTFAAGLYNAIADQAQYYLSSYKSTTTKVFTLTISDTDTTARFIPRRFMTFFTHFEQGSDSLCYRLLYDVLQANVADSTHAWVAIDSTGWSGIKGVTAANFTHIHTGTDSSVYFMPPSSIARIRIQTSTTTNGAGHNMTGSIYYMGKTGDLF